jgi:Ser/Thr protein kinase RdoA (MazF antagonist)
MPAADPLSHQTLSDETAREICRAFALSGEVTGPAAPQPLSGGFSGARLFRWTDQAGHAWVWRAIPAATVNEPRLRQIAAWALRWQSAGVPVAPFRPLANGSSPRISAAVDAPPETAAAGSQPMYSLHLPKNDGWSWIVEPFLPGSADYSTRPDSARLSDVMQHLARLHASAPDQARLSSTPPAGLVARCERWNEFRAAWTDPGERLARIDPSLRELALSFWRLADLTGPEIMRHAAGACIHTSAPALPCVRDIWHDNLLFSDDRLTGLVDLHSAGIDCVAADLTRLLGSLHPFEPNRWTWALTEYERIRPLTIAERRLLRPYERTSVLLSGCHWLDAWARRAECQTSVPPQTIARERSRLEHLQQRLLRGDVT